MESLKVAEFFKDKSILITGSTGFLAKIFVEKVLRVQPNVKKLFLLVRASDYKSAEQRVQNEVVRKELFIALKEKYGDDFQSFMNEKLVPVVGDIAQEHLGINDADLRQKLWNEIDIVANVAATTNFYDRYDVALDINVLGAKHALDFAKKCRKIEMLLHISTAYVAGFKGGLIPERKFRMGETLDGISYLDIEYELRIVNEKKHELKISNATKECEKETMKELGLERAKLFGWPNTYVFTKAMGEMLLGSFRGDLPVVILRPTIITGILKEPLPGWIEGVRTVDSLIFGYTKGNLPCLFGSPKTILDLIPGDMVANAMMVAIVAHANKQYEFVYHIGSSVRNPVTSEVFLQCGYNYFVKHPRIGKDGKAIRTKMIPQFETMLSFRIFVMLKYKLPLEILHLINFASFGYLASNYKELNRTYTFLMRLADLYAPFAWFEGRFDDTSAEKLRIEILKDREEGKIFYFDPKDINWSDYFYNIHIPGVLKYCKKKQA